MIYSFNNLRKILDPIVEQLYSLTDINYNLRHTLQDPKSKDSWGLITSDIAIQLGKQLRKSTLDISTQILDQIKLRGLQDWQVNRDILCYNPTQPSNACLTFQNAEWSLPRKIEISIFCEDDNHLLYKRMLACLAIQSSVANYFQIPCSFIYNTKQLQLNQELQRQFKFHFNPQEKIANFFQELAAKNSQQTNNQISSAIVSHKLINSNSQLFRCADQVFVPRKNWCQQINKHADDFNNFASISYLASDVDSIDLDPFVVQSNERSNLIWYLESTKKRLARFNYNDLDPSDQLPYHSELNHWLLLINRLPFVAADMLVFSEVSSALSFITDCLNKINFFINNLKINAHNQEFKSSDLQILSSHNKLLSDIVHLLSAL